MYAECRKTYTMGKLSHVAADGKHKRKTQYERPLGPVGVRSCRVVWNVGRSVGCIVGLSRACNHALMWFRVVQSLYGNLALYAKCVGGVC